MKHTLIAVTLAATLAACATPAQTPDQAIQNFITQFCPIASAIEVSVAATPGLDTNLVAQLAKASVIVDPVCKAGITDLSSIKSISTEAIPILTAVVSQAALPNAPEIILGLNLANAVITQLQ